MKQQTTRMLAADGSTDAHYTLVGSPDPAALGPGAIVANSNAPPIPPWISNGPNSKWLAPLANADAGLNPGIYIYETTFDLTGFNLSTIGLSGQWATDNMGSIILNGVPVSGNSSGFTAFSPFTIGSGFVSGLNTLDFLVTNMGSGPNPTGFRAEVNGTGTTGSGCDLAVGTANANPWITLTHTGTSPLVEGAATQLTASVLQDSAGGGLLPSNLGVLTGLPISFGNPVNGSLSNVQRAIQPSGTATATLTLNSTGQPIPRADVGLDKATATARIRIEDFSLYAASASPTLNVGTATSTTYDLTLSEVNGFSSPVSLTCTAPSGVTVTCSPSTINGAGAHELTQMFPEWNQWEGAMDPILRTAGGWSYSLPRVSAMSAVSTFGCIYDYKSNYVFSDASGGRHNLDLATDVQLDSSNLDCRDGGLSPVSFGGDELYLADWSSPPSGSISSPDGTVYGCDAFRFTIIGFGDICGSVTDRNGNQIAINDLGGGDQPAPEAK